MVSCSVSAGEYLRAKEKYQKAVGKAKLTYIKELERIQVSMTKKGNLDAAIRIKHEITTLMLPTGHYRVRYSSNAVRTYKFDMRSVSYQDLRFTADIKNHKVVLSGPQIERWTRQEDGTFRVEHWSDIRDYGRKPANLTGKAYKIFE
jgi:hypothetical protein